jgi:adenylate cyclase
MERKLAAILAADVVGYTSLMERNEADTFERLQAHRKEVFEPEIARHHGQIFKLMGDGLLAEFGSVVDAVECAVALQRSMAERNAAVETDRRIDVRIGINLGEVIVEGEDRYGEGVIVASRLQQLAEPGGICVSGKVAREVEKTLAFGFEPMGEQHVKNIAQPITVYRVKLDRGAAPAQRRRMKPAISQWAWLIAAAILLVIGSGTVAWYGFMRPPPPHVVAAQVPSIAVLPFDNMSGNQSLGYLGDGISEDIISMLSRFPDISVVARNSSFAYKGKPEDVRKIGSELGVDYVLEGSVRKDANELRIVAQLIDAHDGQHVWADRFDKSGPDPWALQDEVTAKIIATLTGELGAIKQADYRRAWGKDATNLEEYDYYLRGHDFLMRETKKDYERAAEIWREGLAKFPNSSLLKVKLGFYHFFRAFSFWSDNPAVDYRKAGELVRDVLANEHLSPQVARLAHWLMAFVLAQEREFDHAVAEAEKAKDMAPYDGFVAGRLAPILIMSGKPDQALEWVELAAAKDPNLNVEWNYKRGWIFCLQGKYEQSIAALNQVGSGWPDIPLLQAIDNVRLGRLDVAKSLVKKAHKIDPGFTLASWRSGYFYSDPSITEREVADLTKAGLPEK